MHFDQPTNQPTNQPLVIDTTRCNVCECASTNAIVGLLGSLLYEWLRNPTLGKAQTIMVGQLAGEAGRPQLTSKVKATGLVCRHLLVA